MRIREFSYVRKSDRSVLLTLLAMALVVAGLLYGLSRPANLAEEASSLAEENPSPTGAMGNLTAKERAYPAEGANRKAASPYYAVETVAPERFVFDPNTADSTQLLRLGLQPWQVRNIYKYRAHGGIYRQPSDFARLYGLTQKQYRELEPYIRISSDYRPASELFKTSSRPSQGLYPTTTPSSTGSEALEGHSSAPSATAAGYPVKIHPGEHVVLNQADTTALKTVPGIGSYYARRIVGYGQRLGGYAAVGQLLEIEGFPEEALSYFQVDAAAIRRLNVNLLSLSQLRQHPYLNFYQARAITDYRRLKGNLKSLDDLRLLPEFPPEVIDKLKPYVTF